MSAKNKNFKPAKQRAKAAPHRGVLVEVCGMTVRFSAYATYRAPYNAVANDKDYRD